MSAFVTRATPWIDALKLAWPTYARYLRWIFQVVMTVIFCIGAGAILEANVTPLIILQSTSLGHQEPDNRLCWDWYFTKTRNALAIGAYARLYVGDAPTPILLGLEHGDGSPFGSNFNDAHPAPVSEPWSVRSCIQVPDAVWRVVNANSWQGPHRLGVRPIIIYQDLPFWTFSQQAAWVDYYPK